MCEIREISFTEFSNSSSYSGLIDGYESECTYEGFPPANLNKDLYKKLNDMGILKVFGAYLGDLLVGYCCLLISPNLHFSAPIGTVESFFVFKEHRNTGAGLKLLKAVEHVSKNNGAISLSLSTKKNSLLEKVMEGMKDYHQSNVVYMKRLI